MLLSSKLETGSPISYEKSLVGSLEKKDHIFLIQLFNSDINQIHSLTQNLIITLTATHQLYLQPRCYFATITYLILNSYFSRINQCKISTRSTDTIFFLLYFNTTIFASLFDNFLCQISDDTLMSVAKYEQSWSISGDKLYF